MKSEKLINKDTNQEMKTQEGVTMTKETLEENDLFVPIWNKVVDENRGGYIYHKLKAMVKDVNDEENKEVYLELTPNQARQLKNKSNEMHINQCRFRVYSYDKVDEKTNKTNTYLGVRLDVETPEPRTDLL